MIQHYLAVSQPIPVGGFGSGGGYAPGGYNMLLVVVSTTNTHKDIYDLRILEQVTRFPSRPDLGLLLMGM
jgi:hypothetical protein